MFLLFKATKFLRKRVPFKLADIGEGISEVQIIQWHVKEGSIIKQFEKIAEVQSDKATVEITSRFDGIVKKLHYAVNDMAKVGEPLIEVETEAENIKTTGSELEPESAVLPHKTDNINITESFDNTDTITDNITESTDNTKIITDNYLTKKESKKTITGLTMLPSVRKYVEENSINLDSLNLCGRITKEDIIEATLKSPKPANDQFRELKRNPVQKAMARAMEESLKIPHFGYSDEYRMDNLLKIRNKYNETRLGAKASIMAFIIRAVSLAVKDFPSINAHYLNGKLMSSSILNLGIAVDTPHGLVVPVLKDLSNNSNSIAEIASKLSDLTDRARRNKLNKEDFEGATLTISNIGTIGGTYASPVIVSPQVCIAAMGKIRSVPVFTEAGAIEPQKFACFSWSADHRAVDGATMARFSNRIKELIEMEE